MRDAWVIVEREFLARVRTKAYLAGTIVFPLFLAAIVAVPQMFRGDRAEYDIVVINEAPAPVGERFREALVDPPAPAGEEADDDAPIFRLTMDAGPAEAVREELTARIVAEELDGYVVLPPDLVEGADLVYRGRNVTNLSLLRSLEEAATIAVRVERLGEAGLTAAQVAELVRPVDVDASRITERGQEAGDAEQTFYVAYLLAFAVYMLVAMYGNGVMRSVLEEKTNRIAEVLMSSMRAEELLAGKILGVSAAVMLQVAIWAGVLVLGLTQAEHLGLPGIVDGGLTFGFGVGQGLALLSFLVFGFLVYAALYAALGAAVTTEQEAQSLQMMLLVPLFAPLLFLAAILNDPSGVTSRFLSLFPLSTPVAMPMRLATAPVPDWELWAAVLGLVVAGVLLTWVAARIYRIGMLSTGRRATLKDIVHWLRAA